MFIIILLGEYLHLLPKKETEKETLHVCPTVKKSYE